MQEGTQKYELLYILPAKYTESELKAMAEKINATLTTLGGVVSEFHLLGRRKLEYVIKNVRNGDYTLVYFEAEPARLAKINDTFRLSNDILRHMIVKRDPKITSIPSFKEEENPYQHVRGEHSRRDHAARKPMVETVTSVPVDIDKKIDEMLTEEVI